MDSLLLPSHISSIDSTTYSDTCRPRRWHSTSTKSSRQIQVVIEADNRGRTNTTNCDSISRLRHDAACTSHVDVAESNDIENLLGITGFGTTIAPSGDFGVSILKFRTTHISRDTPACLGLNTRRYAAWTHPLDTTRCHTSCKVCRSDRIISFVKPY